MGKFVDFGTIYGKLGMHPGALNAEQAAALFLHVGAYKRGARIEEFWPDGGRSTVVIAAAARNIEAKVNVCTNWESQPPAARRWFEQALRTFKLEDVVSVNEQAEPRPMDLLVIRVEMAIAAPDGVAQLVGLADKVFVLGGNVDISGTRKVEAKATYGVLVREGMAKKVEMAVSTSASVES